MFNTENEVVTSTQNPQLILCIAATNFSKIIFDLKKRQMRRILLMISMLAVASPPHKHNARGLA